MTNTTETNTTTRDLIDAETGKRIGYATAEQAEYSDDAQDGIISIDADGNVVVPGTWVYDNCERRQVWVEEECRLLDIGEMLDATAMTVADAHGILAEEDASTLYDLWIGGHVDASDDDWLAELLVETLYAAARRCIEMGEQ